MIPCMNLMPELKLIFKWSTLQQSRIKYCIINKYKINWQELLDQVKVDHGWWF